MQNEESLSSRDQFINSLLFDKELVNTDRIYPYSKIIVNSDPHGYYLQVNSIVIIKRNDIYYGVHLIEAISTPAEEWHSNSTKEEVLNELMFRFNHNALKISKHFYIPKDLEVLGWDGRAISIAKKLLDSEVQKLQEFQIYHQ